MPRTSTKPRKAYHHGNLRRALIDAALDAIAEHGPERFTLRDAARRAGVSSGAPYKHFPDKDSLLAAVAAECSERLGAAMNAAVAAAADDPVDQFRATGIAYVRFAVEHPAHFRVMNVPGVAERLPEPLRTEVDAWKARQRAALAAAQRTGALSDAQLDDILLAAHCLVHGLAHLIVDGHPGFTHLSPSRASTLAHRITGIFGEGLLPRPMRRPRC
jgi:AcrR family transcriptional regulator